MINIKTENFIEKITTNTERGLVEWTAEGRDAFKFSTERASLYIGQSLDLDTGRRITTFSVYDDNGEVVELVEHIVDFRSPSDTCVEYLYSQARRVAHNADSVFESIIHDIEHPDQDGDDK